MSKPAPGPTAQGLRRRPRRHRPARQPLSPLWMGVLALVLVAFDVPWIAALVRVGLSQGWGPFVGLLAFTLAPVATLGFLLGVQLARRPAARPPYLRVIRPEKSSKAPGVPSVLSPRRR
ncbi:MAG: hypothetical protein K6U14_04855 [Firmicutes bacterium]|nr:hypothetical protein [Alicyclobacillaceae bacterium]MCL6496950.1 hypothetical protein [Bacillota bacterium]